MAPNQPDEPTEADPLNPDARDSGPLNGVQSSDAHERPQNLPGIRSLDINSDNYSDTSSMSRLSLNPRRAFSDDQSDGTRTPSYKKNIRWHGDQYRGDGPRRSVSGEDIPNSFNDGGSKPGTPLPGTPTTPHIVVSGDQCEANQDFGQAEINLKSEDGRVTPIDAQSIEGSGRLLGLDAGEQRARHNSISSYLSPEIGINLSRKTRRNSMIDMMQRASSVNNLCLTPTQQQHLARVAAAATIKHGTSRTSLSPSNIDWRHEGNDSMIACLSALYGKILVVMGLAFPIGDFISGRMSAVVFKAFKLYLHIGSIIFLVFAYMFLLRAVSISKVDVKARLQSLNRNKSSELERGGEGGNEDARSMSVIGPFQGNKNYTITESTHESMYLKMGAMVFGIGSMIYSGLEVGRYFDFRAVPECDDPLRFVSPVSRMIFTFIQMYFIFLNSRVAINKHRIIARFGLMHMIATNLCIWLNVLVEETKHEIHSFQHKLHHDAHLHDLGNGTAAVLGGDHHVMSTHNTTSGDSLHPGASLHHFVPDKDEHHIVRRATDSYSLYDYCQETGMMKNLVENASHFLYPCTIEYSLLCSGVLYVIWKNINKSDKGNNGRSGDSDISTFIARKARHHYSVDCAHATRGLFMGILVLVLTIISLILFFVLISNEKMKSVAVLEANIIELSLYSVAIITVVIGMVQMRELEFVEDGDIELDNILLLIAQTGTYIYTSFSIIGGNINESSERLLSFMTAVITLIQTTLQTLFILNASRRCCYTYDQLTRKPGREMVTFLLICNLAMWAISTFETSRADAHPTLVNYYGVWAWTIISHVSMPLAIFYRFHVTVCLCEIWKRSYKLKHDFI